MFKPLLRTLPTLSGNFTINCKLKEYNKEGSNDYNTYVRLANITPLQNSLMNKNIEVNLLNGKYEYDIVKYYYYYYSSFYKSNFKYNKNNYKVLNLDSLYNYVNDARNKDYEFGCKRLSYVQSGNQFNFYAPIYIDNANNLPEYFIIHILFSNTIEKRIKVYINKDNYRNYLKNYLIRYLNQIDDRVIFLSSESKTAVYYGIDVKNGNITQYKDAEVSNLFDVQTTINNYDYTLCNGFERNNLIMRQIIPLSFSFNINDILNNYEKKFFSGAKVKIYGEYYSKYDMQYNMYDFNINYTNFIFSYHKYNEYNGQYEYISPMKNNKYINIMDIGYPSFNESKYIKYLHTNKITPMYCRFKMYSSKDYNPYISNINFSYSYNRYPYYKYGDFPTTLKGIFPNAVIIDNDLKLPIGRSLDDYYKVSDYFGNKVILDTANIDKYNKLMNNNYSLWYYIQENDIDFSSNIEIENFINNSTWTDISDDYTYYKGILYNLSKLHDERIDKFAVFCHPTLDIIKNEDTEDDEPIVRANLIFQSQILSTGKKFYNYNENYNMESILATIGNTDETDNTNNIIGYNKIFDISLSENIIPYMQVNKTMKRDIYGDYIEEEHYKEENDYYKVDDILSLLNTLISLNILNEYTKQQIINEINSNKFVGYILIDTFNNANFFNKEHKLIFDKKPFGTYEYNDKYSWLSDKLYVSTQFNTNKQKFENIYSYIQIDEDLYGKICLYLKYDMIHYVDLINIFNQYNCNYIDYKNLLDSYKSYNYQIMGNENGIICNNYLIENVSPTSYIYVDSYNLQDYIQQYKKLHGNFEDNYDLETESNIFVKLLSKTYLLEYSRNMTNNMFKDLYVKEYKWDIETNKLEIQEQYHKFIHYIKKAFNNWKTKINLELNSSEQNTFNNYCNNISKYFDILSECARNDNLGSELFNQINNDFSSYFTIDDIPYIKEWIFNYIQDENKNNMYIIKIPVYNNYVFSISVDLFLNRTLYYLNYNLYQMLNDNCYMYLYTKLNKNESYDNWEEKTDMVNISSELETIVTTPHNYVSPLFTNVYLNNNDINIAKKIINSSKIFNKNDKLSKYQYIINNYRYFKEINIDKTLRDEILNKDANFINEWINYIKNINANDYKDETDVNDFIKKFESEWNEYRLNLDINDEILYDTTKFKENVDIILNYLQTYNNGKYYEQYRKLVKYKGIILYSITPILDVKYLMDNNNENTILTYDNKNKIYKFSYNGINYGFYWINIHVDNTSNSFNIEDDFGDISYFTSINKHNYKGEIIIEQGESENNEIDPCKHLCISKNYYKKHHYNKSNNNVSTNNSLNTESVSNKIDKTLEYFNRYFCNIFYLVAPFIKSNILYNFTNNINTVVIPNELKIDILFGSSKTNDKELYKKYKTLLDNDSDILYYNITELEDQYKTKMKLSRYFNYIIPMLNETSTIKNCWELKFMGDNITYKNKQKYNIIDKQNINIYKYNGLKYFDGDDYDSEAKTFINEYKETISPEIVYQYEYKHFNDNSLYNLPEEIIIEDPKEYSKENIQCIEKCTDIEQKKIEILNNYFKKLGYNNEDAKLFLFNKYDSIMIIDLMNIKAIDKSEKYKVLYKFTLK